MGSQALYLDAFFQLCQMNRALVGDAAFDAAVRAVHPAVAEQMQRATAISR